MADNQNIQHIRLHIYDTDISVNVPADQEEAYRKAGALINDRLNAYFGPYKGRKSDKEIMYYAMIDIALNCVNQTQRNDVGPMADILKQLTAEVEDVLNEKK